MRASSHSKKICSRVSLSAVQKQRGSTFMRKRCANLAPVYHPSMPAQRTHHHSQGRHPEYARPGIKCYRKMATPAIDAEKEGPCVASCQKKRNEKSEKRLPSAPIRHEVAFKPLQGKGLSLK